MPTTCRALGVAVGTRVLQHFFSLLQLGPSCLLRSLLVSHSEVGAADSINTYSVCSPFAVQISIHLLPICSSSAGVQQSPCSPSAVPHRQLHRQFAHSCCDDHLITLPLPRAHAHCNIAKCYQLGAMVTLTPPPSHVFTRIGCRVFYIMHHTNVWSCQFNTSVCV